MKHILVFIIAVILQIHSSQSYNLGDDCSDNAFKWLPHLTDCSRYTICRDGIAFERSCAPGLLFNFNFGHCTIPREAYCLFSCPKTADGDLVFLPKFQDCSEYFICNQGHAVHRNCANGLVFDVKKNWCDFPENVSCIRSSNGAIIEHPNDGNNPPPSPVPDPGDGDVTIPDDSGETETTPRDDDETTSTEDISDEPIEVTTTEVPTTTFNPNVFDCPLDIGPLYFPHSIYCFKYFKCYRGISYLQKCPEGELFDHIENICKEDAICYNPAENN